MKSIFKSSFILLFLAVILIFGQDALAAKFYFAPAGGSMSSNCENSLDIMIDTEGAGTIAADAIIEFNPDDIEIIDQSPAPGIQIKTGGAYEMYPGNKIDPSGKIFLTGFDSLQVFNGTGIFGSIVFKSKPGVQNTEFNFYFQRNLTTDSNVANLNSEDVLTAASGANFSFLAMACDKDLSPPRLENISPAVSAKNVAWDSKVAFNIVDDGAGVDLSTVKVVVDGVRYAVDEEVSFDFTGDKNDYKIIIDPLYDFFENDTINVEIKVADLKGNVMPTFFYSFSTGKAIDQEPVLPADFMSEEVTVPQDLRLDLSQVEFWAAAHTVPLLQSKTGVISILPLSVFTAEFNASALSKPVKDAQLAIGSSIYQFAKTSDGLLYKVSLQSDAEPGFYPAKIIIRYLDGSIDAVDFAVNVLPWGDIYETISGEKSFVPDATIMLTDDTSNAIWPGSAFSQANPSQSDLEGSFGFLTAPGQYKIKIEKEGYKTREVFFDNGSIINPSIELLALPKPLATAGGAIGYIKSFGKLIKFKMKSLAQTLSLPGVTRFAANVLFPAALIATLVNLLNALVSLRWLVYLFLWSPMAFVRKQHKDGLVFDAKTNRPVPLAVVHLIDIETDKIVATQITGRNGHYSFRAKKGSYKIFVRKPHYKYSPDNETIEVTEPIGIIAKNVAMEHVGESKLPNGLIKFGIFAQKTVAMIACFIVLAEFILDRTYFNLFLLIVNLAIVILIFGVAKKKATRNFNKI
ncbi:MAG TPA: Ig-like domain-containing protein [Candidatus Bipolaricaulota bacterium]|nr:Ig-like domain-containing protein [Candidatus Bipolaricaulota bacterium]